MISQKGPNAKNKLRKKLTGREQKLWPEINENTAAKGHQIVRINISGGKAKEYLAWGGEGVSETQT